MAFTPPWADGRPSAARRWTTEAQPARRLRYISSHISILSSPAESSDPRRHQYSCGCSGCRTVLDKDSTEITVYGEQEQSAYNGHFESTCYHPLLLFIPANDSLERDIAELLPRPAGRQRVPLLGWELEHGPTGGGEGRASRGGVVPASRIHCD